MCEFTKSNISQLEEEIERQRKLLGESPILKVLDVCQPSKGILRISKIKATRFEKVPFPNDPCFFIPASGSGSRMFSFLFQFLIDEIETREIKYFFNNLDLFPFYEELSNEVEGSLSSMGKKEIIKLLLFNDGMGLSDIPKGMIPFHYRENTPLRPFQEHCLQFSEISNSGRIHYTVQEEFISQIKSIIEADTAHKLNVEYSFQDPMTDAYCFDLDGKEAIVDGNRIKRPAGHGALLKNLNNLESEIVCVKNIDNIQPIGRHNSSVDTWKLLYGLMASFKKDLLELASTFSLDALSEFNTQYEVFRSEDLHKIDTSNIKDLCDRPTRVCGMVKNEGEPGGGPFWVEYDGIATKQIVEKVQLSKDQLTDSLLVSSTHFNPVFMILDLKTVNGERRDLNEFVDKNSFLRVEKDHKGQKIIYHELPGLWNGAMALWNTIFVEIPKEVFTPVKTVLDLINEDHLV